MARPVSTQLSSSTYIHLYHRFADKLNSIFFGTYPFPHYQAKQTCEDLAGRLISSFVQLDSVGTADRDKYFTLLD